MTFKLKCNYIGIAYETDDELSVSVNVSEYRYGISFGKRSQFKTGTSWDEISFQTVF